MFYDVVFFDRKAKDVLGPYEAPMEHLEFHPGCRALTVKASSREEAFSLAVHNIELREPTPAQPTA